MQFAYLLTPCRPTLLQDMTDAESAKVAEHFDYLKRMQAAGELILAGVMTAKLHPFRVALARP